MSCIVIFHKRSPLEDSKILFRDSRAFVANSTWAEKDDFLDVIYWLRQLLGVLVGLAWGALGVSGAAGIIGFAAINAAVLYAYWTAFQQIDEEEYGGPWELTKEGFMPSSAGFLVVWIIMYTGLHFD